MKVLLCEPQVLLARRLGKNLKKDGFAVSLCFEREKVPGYFFQSRFGFLVLSLDRELDKTNSAIRQIRKRDKDCKIVAVIDRPVFEVGETLRLGVDDYIKRGELNELGIRLWLLKRRIAPINAGQVFFHGDFSLHEELSLLRYRDREISLSKTERLILYELFGCGGSIDSKLLIQRVWDDDMIVGTNRLQFHISVLRRKIRTLSERELIRTIKGRGYGLV